MINAENRALDDQDFGVEVRAIRALGSMSRAWKWMDEPNPDLDGSSPRKMLNDDEGREQVFYLLEKLERARKQMRSGKKAAAG